MSGADRGQITFENMSKSRVLQKFSEKRLMKWLSREAGELERGWNYDIVFAKEGTGHEVSCFVRVSCGQKIWQGAQIAEGPQLALIRSLERMQCKDEAKVFKLG